MTGMFEMPISVTPRIPKNASCDVCGSKKFKSMTGKLYTLEYSLSQASATLINHHFSHSLKSISPSPQQSF